MWLFWARFSIEIGLGDFLHGRPIGNLIVIVHFLLNECTKFSRELKCW